MIKTGLDHRIYLSVKFKITVHSEAEVGDREFYIRSQLGMPQYSQPTRFLGLGFGSVSVHIVRKEKKSYVFFLKLFLYLPIR